MYLGGFYLSEIWFSGAPNGIPSPNPATVDRGRGGLILERPLRRKQRRFEEKKVEIKSTKKRLISVAYSPVEDTPSRDVPVIRVAGLLRINADSLIVARCLKTTGIDKRLSVRTAGINTKLKVPSLKLNRYGFIASERGGFVTKHAAINLDLSVDLNIRTRRVNVSDDEEAVRIAIDFMAN